MPAARTTRWSHEPDVIVLGGGIIGAAAARELTRAGASVRLLDAGGVGSGTSSRCDGNLLVQTKHDDIGIALMRSEERRVGYEWNNRRVHKHGRTRVE